MCDVVFVLSFKLAFAFSNACAIRVGQEMGASNPIGAKTAYYVAYITECKYPSLAIAMVDAVTRLESANTYVCINVILYTYQSE